MIYCLILIVILLAALVYQGSSTHYRAAARLDSIAADLANIREEMRARDILEKIEDIQEAVLMIRLQTAPDDEDPPLYP
jgi:Tfp pilus assembly protein PilV